MAPFPHLMILLPGIMGSVLQYEGRDLWAFSRQAITGGLRRADVAIERLALHNEDLELDVLDDGIRATRLIEEMYNIPHFIKGSGYQTIQRELEHAFKLRTGNMMQPQPFQNFFPFPYDWRRDIRINARLLGRFIERQLPQWQNHSKRRDARVVIVAHSMGGLVARAYIELLGGHEHVEMLYTIGTPHRGSPNALHALSNGLEARPDLEEGVHKQVIHYVVNRELRALSNIIRTFSSIYQLLPVYPCVANEGEIVRISELHNIPNVDQIRARTARDVIVSIGEAALSRRQQDLTATAPTYPVVGFGQDTAQQAFRIKDGSIALSRHPLPEAEGGDGDGTVPDFSAVPVETQVLRLGNERFINQHHGWLPNGRQGLLSLIADISYRLRLSKAPILNNGEETEERALNVRVNDLYTRNENVVVRASTQNTPEHVLPLITRVTQMDGSERREVVLHTDGNEWSATMEGLPTGLYRLEVLPQATTPLGPHPVFTSFEVADVQG